MWVDDISTCVRLQTKWDKSGYRRNEQDALASECFYEKSKKDKEVF